ncbi:MAG TPA: protein translocase subunit SecF [Acidothermaceae bacterium]
MSRLGTIGHNLYTGKVSYDFVGKWRRWLALSGVVIIISLIGLGVRGLNLSLEFKGGSQFTFPDKGFSNAQIADVVTGAGTQVAITDPVIQTLTQAGVGTKSYQVETEALSKDDANAVVGAITSKLGVSADDVSTNTVGSSWGDQITKKAIQSLIIFIVAVIIYLSLRYEWKMAASAIIALIHDLIITVGIYALVGFEVSPSTVIGLLTILGYSLYDTVVVFDKVRENTKEIAGGSRMTYSQAANLAVNQTLVRSINTSVIALLPVASLLFVGAGLLGAGSLKDLALALFIGLATGTYSSIFIATPLAALFKEREPQFQALARRVAARQGAAARTPVAVAAAGAGTDAAATPAADADSADAGEPTGEPGRANPPTPAAEPAAPTAGLTPSGAARTPAVRRSNSAQRRPGNRPAGKKKRR